MNFLQSFRLTNTSAQTLYSNNKFKLISVKSNQIDTLDLLKPECQRAVDTEQVNSIFTYQIKHFKNFPNSLLSISRTLFRLIPFKITN